MARTIGFIILTSMSIFLAGCAYVTPPPFDVYDGPQVPDSELAIVNNEVPGVVDQITKLSGTEAIVVYEDQFYLLTSHYNQWRLLPGKYEFSMSYWSPPFGLWSQQVRLGEASYSVDLLAGHHYRINQATSDGERDGIVVVDQATGEELVHTEWIEFFQ